MIQRHKLTEADFRGERFKNHSKDLQGNNDLLILTRPDVIAEIHGQYLAAGADIIETNTFSSTTVAQADYLLEDVAYELNVEGARIAKAVAAEWTAKTPDRPRFVAGSIGPTNRTLSISPEVNNPAFRAITFDELRIAYEEQVRGLIDGGADLILLETIFDTLNSKAGIVAIENVYRGEGRPPAADDLVHDHGQERPHAVGPDARSLLHVGPPRAPVQHRHQLRARRARHASVPRRPGAHRRVLRHRATRTRACRTPSATTTSSPPKPASSSRTSPPAASSTSSAAAAAPLPITSRRSRKPSREFRPASAPEGESVHLTELSGLEPLVIRPDSNFQMVGERTNVTGSAKFARLIKAGNYTEAATVALDQVRGGANIIDVNVDEGMLDSEQVMTTFLNYIATEPEIARVPVMIDSSKWTRARGGPEVRPGQGRRQLDQPQGRRGGLPRQGAQDPALRRRGRRHGVRRNRPGRHGRAEGRDLQARLQAAHRAGRASIPSDIIFDPNILAIATGLEEHNDYAVNYIEATRILKATLPGRQDQRRRQQPVVLLPRQRHRPRSDALGVPVPRHQGRHGHGHRQRRAARRLRGHPEGPARARRGRDLQPPPRRDRAAGAARRIGEGNRARRRKRTWRGAAAPSRSACPTRSSTGPSSSSTRTSRKRARSIPSRSTSSRGR